MLDRSPGFGRWRGKDPGGNAMYEHVGPRRGIVLSHTANSVRSARMFSSTVATGARHRLRPAPG